MPEYFNHNFPTWVAKYFRIFGIENVVDRNARQVMWSVRESENRERWKGFVGREVDKRSDEESEGPSSQNEQRHVEDILLAELECFQEISLKKRFRLTLNEPARIQWTSEDSIKTVTYQRFDSAHDELIKEEF